MDSLQTLEESLSIDIRLEETMMLTSDLIRDLIVQEGGEPCESPFNSTQIPAIDLLKFIQRLHKYTQFSRECLIIAIIYMDRYNMANSEFSLNEFNVHKMLLTSLLLATKFQDDEYYDNKAFEFAGGVNVSQLMLLELHFMEQVDNKLFVDEEEFRQLECKLYEVYGGVENEDLE